MLGGIFRVCSVLFGFCSNSFGGDRSDCFPPFLGSLNGDRIVQLLSSPGVHDPLLAMRAGLQQLADSLHAVLEMAEDCEVKMATETSPSSASPSPREVVQKLKNLVSAGHLNDGFCPFTGKRQRTIGGAEVSDVMEELQVPRKTKRLARIIGKLLLQIQAEGDGPAPAGVAPVNWEMREALFGTAEL